MIIDTHIHFYDPSRPEGVPWPPADNALLHRTVLPDSYQPLAAAGGISGAIVVEASPWLEDNQWLLDLAQRHAIIVGIVGHIPPGQPSFGAALSRFSADARFCGIRCGASYFTGPPAPALLADLEELAAMDRALDVLIRREHVDALIQVAQAVPSLRIIVDHIGHMPIDGQPISADWIARYRRLAAAPTISMKVSALPEQSTTQPAPTDMAAYAPTLDVLWATFGEDRLIYGSNWPVCEMAGPFTVGLDVVKAYFAQKGERAYAKFFRENALNTYQIPFSP